MIRQMIVQILESEGIDAISASCSKTALKLFDTLTIPPDLMICDICMPIMSGVELYQHVEKQFPQQPVLFITGYPDSHTELCHDILTNENLLRKPFRVAELIQRVQQIIAQ